MITLFVSDRGSPLLTYDSTYIVDIGTRPDFMADECKKVIYELFVSYLVFLSILRLFLSAASSPILLKGRCHV